jgi:hypothetical protein
MQVLLFIGLVMATQTESERISSIGRTPSVAVIRTNVKDGAIPEGKYFWFNPNRWGSAFGSFANDTVQKVEQWRDGKKIWTGDVKIFAPDKNNKDG